MKGKIFNWLASRRTQIAQNTEAINTLKDRLGKFEGRTLENMLGITTDESLSGQFQKIREQFDKDIGIHSSNTYSLTAQHDNILKYLKDKDDKQDKALQGFSLTEKNISSTIEEMQLFFRDWETDKQIIQKKDRLIAELTVKNEALEQENTSLKSSLHRAAHNTISR